MNWEILELMLIWNIVCVVLPQVLCFELVRDVLVERGTVLRKLFLDFSLDGAAVNPYMECCWSKLHFCRSDWLDTSRRMLGVGGGRFLPSCTPY